MKFPTGQTLSLSYALLSKLLIYVLSLVYACLKISWFCIMQDVIHKYVAVYSICVSNPHS